MKSVNLLIKPASSLCNLRCRYCFYADVAANRGVPNYGMMGPDTAEALIKAAFDGTKAGDAVAFGFQGGEPTLAGLAFFRGFLELAARHARPGVSVSYSIQTNGMLLDGEWAAFFHENRFLVGLSIDADREIHDLHRVDPQGKGTWGRAVRALRLLEKHRVEVNLLCVVTRACARSPGRVYGALKKLGARYLQFIPCLDPLEEERGKRPFSLLPADYGDFLCDLFDAWYRDWKAGAYVSVRLFDDYVHVFMGQNPGSCAVSGRCGGYFVVEGDGGVYPCDFYVLDTWHMGNVADGMALRVLAQNPIAAAFVEESCARPAACVSCRWSAYCRGGCRRDLYMSACGAENYYCAAFQRFFAHAEDRLREIAAAELAHAGRRIP